MYLVRSNYRDEKQKTEHDFLKHYEKGKEVPFEEKPLDIIRYPALTIYKIEFKKYNKDYDFNDSEKCVDTFLRNINIDIKQQTKNGLNVHLR